MKILVAEDEQEILHIYKILFEEAGYDLVSTSDGAECMEVFRKALSSVNSQPPFDLVILDHRMPKKTGLEVATDILAICPTQQLLLVTAYDIEYLEKSQNVKLLKKPFDIEHLISVVASCMGTEALAEGVEVPTTF
jgi:two-component system cell cycle response regulator CpdR